MEEMIYELIEIDDVIDLATSTPASLRKKLPYYDKISSKLEKLNYQDILKRKNKIGIIIHN